jgi:uncharacterized protein (DUF1800 family)
MGMGELGKRWLSVCLLLAAAPAAAQSGGFFSDGFEPLPPGEAARFLTQATFGPTLGEITRVQDIGPATWLNEQFALPPTLQLPLIERRYAEQGVDRVWGYERHAEWLRTVATAPDQLRQRVAFALSQILVVSEQSGDLQGLPNAVASYQDVLLRNAFGNYRTLLEEVTLHPAMGQYLSMLRNRKTNQTGTIQPDENFAREIMQLFSIGLVQLNPDGTPVDGDPAVPGVQPVPTYDQDTIAGFAAVFTGWNLSTCRPTLVDWDINQDTQGSVVEYAHWWEWNWCPIDAVDGTPGKQAAAFVEPMRPWNSYHQAVGAKQLLRYPGVARGHVDADGVLAAGGRASDNLAAALDNLFHHPNVGPFIALRLIQRLVTSNPTPDYVARVAAVFDDDNGAAPGGVRGNLEAVVRAILLDPEARRPATQECRDASTGCIGKLREPLIRLVHLLRAMDAHPTHPDGYWMYGDADRNTGQAAMRSPTVFNFFSPDYALPGTEVAGRGLVSPEFQITTDTYITRLINQLGHQTSWYWSGAPHLQSSGDYRPTVIGLDRDMAIAHDPHALVERYNILFAGGQLPPAVRQLIVDYVAGVQFHDWRSEAETRRLRVSDALWLVLVSPSAAVEK